MAKGIIPRKRKRNEVITGSASFNIVRLYYYERIIEEICEQKHEREISSCVVIKVRGSSLHNVPVSSLPVL